MKLRILLITNAIVAALYGIVALLFPAWLGSLYGFKITDELNFVARLLGGYLLAAAILSWLVRNAAVSLAQTSAMYAFLVMDVLGCLVTLIYVLNGTLNAQGWPVFVIYLLLSVGFAYFLFATPKTE
jgi:uncharacterized membrane protein